MENITDIIRQIEGIRADAGAEEAVILGTAVRDLTRLAELRGGEHPTPLSRDQKYARNKTAVRRALRSGALVRQPCIYCGTTQGVRAYHNDIDKPLDVTWACQLCSIRNTGWGGSRKLSTEINGGSNG